MTPIYDSREIFKSASSNWKLQQFGNILQQTTDILSLPMATDNIEENKPEWDSNRSKCCIIS